MTELETKLKLEPLISIDKWLPLLEDCPVPYPATICKDMSSNTYGKFVDACEVGDVKRVDELLKPYYRTAEEALETFWEIFIKTYYFSGKHSIHDTMIDNEATARQQILDIIMASDELFMGPPIGGLAFREYIPLNSKFRAFHGLPIAKERRLFIKDRELKLDMPYWPEDAIKFFGDTEEPKGWKETLLQMNTDYPIEEHETLLDYAQILYDRFKPLDHNYWSFDFAQGADLKWWFIDCAPAELSWGEDQVRCE